MTESSFERTFRDTRTPHEIQVHFERLLLALFRPSQDGSKLVLRSAKRITGCEYSFELRFECALPSEYFYTLRAATSWAHLDVKYHDYFRKSSQSWFDYWTKPFSAAVIPALPDCSADLYQRIAAHALEAESGLVDVASIQRAILAAMYTGARFSTAHKEGGTNIRWSGTEFRSADYGESEETQTFPDESSFLSFLRKFYDHEVHRDAIPATLSEFDAWKLILRLMRS